ncbi:PAS domain-containing sensor histidine kinase [Sulfurivermis fontis]|uniref:PAS domain-containing sensor histidine kinase n=1 Tax=Sulfurivermis fontis TaxID=1972068 RepID=UPI001558C6B2|nr:PAS domain-containing sensor histidine kinase [Sulfurivermis fontis]
MAFLLAAAVPTAIAGLIGIVYSLNTLKKETLGSLEQEIHIRTEHIGQFFAQLSSELLYLSGTDSLRELHMARASGDAGALRAARERLERDFARFASHYPHIYQVRYISSDGWEVARVDRKGEDTVVVVSTDRLQDKSDRYYFQEAITLAAGEIYVSPLDLNIEFGQVESPERPVIRFGTPVTFQAYHGAGLLIVNLNADILLDQIQQLADTRGGTAYLFDRSGHYLARTAGGEDDAFVMQPVTELIGGYGHAAIGKVLAGERGLEATEGRILAFEPVKFLDAFRYHTSSGGWTLALSFPESRLFLSVLNLSALYIVLFVSLTATAAGGYLVSRRLLGPLDDLSRETEAIAGGDFTRRVQIEGNDEIAGLGDKFNTMAGRLQELIGKLHEHRERLEDEVQARTAELDHERAFLAAVIQHTGDGILAVDAQGRCALVNGAALDLLDGVWRGQTIEAHLPQWPELAAKALATGECRCEIVKDGRVLALSVTRTGDTEETGFVVVVRDVSEERRLQDERRELDRQMFQMEKMTTLGELAMGLAHEIGNPLAGMKAVVQTMRYDDETPAYFQEVLKRLESEIDRLTGFLRTFHGFAAPRAGAPVACDLSTVLGDVLFWTKKDSGSKGIRFSTDVGQVPPLRADPHQLKQVLLNLVINAVHAMPEGGAVDIRASSDNGMVRIEISDTGSGIPADVLPRIFDPFYTTRSDGTGLGLAIVRKIVQDHGARVEVESDIGHGTCFSLLWPAMKPEDHG